MVNRLDIHFNVLPILHIDSPIICFSCSDIVTPVNAEFIPTGEVLAVAGTPWDFTTPHTIAEVTFPPPYVGYDINYGLFDLDEAEAADLTVGCTLLGHECVCYSSALNGVGEHVAPRSATDSIS